MNARLSRAENASPSPPRKLFNSFGPAAFLLFLLASLLFFFFFKPLHGGTPMACARSAPEWPNSFYPENVFRVTLPRKSKFGGLNWVLFHALRSLGWPLQRPRLLLQPSPRNPPTRRPRPPASSSLRLPLALGKARRGSVLAFSSGTSSVVRPTTVLFTLFLAGPTLAPSFPFNKNRWPLRSTSSDAMRRSSRLCKRTRPRYNGCVCSGVSTRYFTAFHGIFRFT